MRKILIVLIMVMFLHIPASAGINDWLTGEYANAGITTYYIGDGGTSSYIMSPFAGMTSGISDATGDNSLIITAASVKLNGVNVGESLLRVWKKEALDCTFAIVNNSEVERTAVIVIAVYSEENYLCGFETVSITLEGGESENAQIIYNFPGNAHRGKIMFWDSLSGMMPLRTEISFSETNGVNAYHYTTDNRLQKVDKANGSSLVYNYDKMGKLTSKTVTGGAEND